MTRTKGWHSAVTIGATSLLVSLAGCGGGGGPTGHTAILPTPTPSPVSTVIHDDSFAVGTSTVAQDTFTTASVGTLAVTVDWAFATDDIDIFVAKGTDPCTLETFNNRTCGFLAADESTTLKPEKLTVTNLAAGAYTLYVANYGSSDEWVACHIILTTAAGASEVSVTTLNVGGTGTAKGGVHRILGPRSLN
jgi:hypothetical protein